MWAVAAARTPSCCCTLSCCPRSFSFSPWSRWGIRARLRTDGQPGGRAGLRGGSWPLPAHTDPVGLASLASPKETSREWLESPKKKKKIPSSSDRASRTTSAASVQATAYGREGLGEQTYGKSLVQPGLDPEHLRNSLLLSFSPPLETQKLSPREMVLLPRITSWTRSPLGELKAPGFPVVCSPHPSWRDLR